MPRPSLFSPCHSLRKSRRFPRGGASGCAPALTAYQASSARSRIPSGISSASTWPELTARARWPRRLQPFSSVPDLARSASTPRPISSHSTSASASTAFPFPMPRLRPQSTKPSRPTTAPPLSLNSRPPRRSSPTAPPACGWPSSRRASAVASTPQTSSSRPYR